MISPRTKCRRLSSWIDSRPSMPQLIIFIFSRMPLSWEIPGRPFPFDGIPLEGHNEDIYIASVQMPGISRAMHVAKNTC